MRMIWRHLLGWGILYSLLLFFETIANRLVFFIGSFVGRSNECDGGVLIARFDAIGDFVLFTSVLSDFRKLYIGSRITLLLRSEVANLAELCPHVDEVLTIDVKRFRRSLSTRLRSYSVLRAKRFDVAINAVYSNNTPFLDCLIGWTYAKRRIALACKDDMGKRSTPKPYYTELIETEGKWKFEISRHHELLKYLGYNGPTSMETRLWVSSNDEARSVELVHPLDGERFAVVIPGSGHAMRNWPAENFEYVCRQISREFRIGWVVCGSSSEEELCRSISASLDRASVPNVNLAGNTTLRELACIAKMSVFCLGNETGGIHIAAAMGTPSVCVIGGGHYGRFYPYPSSKSTIAVGNRLLCYNCYWVCVLNEVECITRVPREKVISEIHNLLGSTNRLHHVFNNPSFGIDRV